MAKSNGIKSLKQAAKLLNKHSPDGESLAYINPEEARLLRASGGSGIMTLQGVPTYGAVWDFTKKFLPPSWVDPLETVGKLGQDVYKWLGYGDQEVPVKGGEEGETKTVPGRSIVQDAMSVWAFLRAKKDKEGLNAAEMEQFNKLNQQMTASKTEFDVGTDLGQQLKPGYETDITKSAAYTPITFDAAGATTPELITTPIATPAEGGRIGAFNGGIQGMPQQGFMPQPGLMPQQGLDPRMGYAAQGGRIGYGLGTRTATAYADPNRVAPEGDLKTNLLNIFANKFGGEKQVLPFTGGQAMSGDNFMANMISQSPQGSQFQLLQEYQNYVTEVGEENAVPFDEWQASRTTAAHGGRIGYLHAGTSSAFSFRPMGTKSPSCL